MAHKSAVTLAVERERAESRSLNLGRPPDFARCSFLNRSSPLAVEPAVRTSQSLSQQPATCASCPLHALHRR